MRGKRRAYASMGAIGKYGLYAAGGALLLADVGYLIVKRVEKRVVEDDEARWAICSEIDIGA